MHLIELLQDHREEIVDAAFHAMKRTHLKHYEEMGESKTYERLHILHGLLVRCVAERNMGPMIAHAEAVGQERYTHGFDLYEVQTAYNVLEESIWVRVLKDLEPLEMAQALGLVSTVIGAGKDALARTFVSLASKSKAPSLNLHSLFAGTDGA